MGSEENKFKEALVYQSLAKPPAQSKVNTKFRPDFFGLYSVKTRNPPVTKSTEPLWQPTPFLHSSLHGVFFFMLMPPLLLFIELLHSLNSKPHFACTLKVISEDT